MNMDSVPLKDEQLLYLADSLVPVCEEWPEAFKNDPKLGPQIAERQQQARRINETLESIPHPTVSVETAVTNQDLSERQAESLYIDLADMLANEDNRRLVLYLPFEVLPAADWTPQDDYLQQAIWQFKDSYMKAWHQLLTVYDVRANFVDGDVLETELREADLPRVVKAAHLAPQLVEKGLLTSQEVTELYETTEDTVLKTSLAEAFGQQPKVAEAAPTAITERRADWLRQKQADQVVSQQAAELVPAILNETTLPSGYSDSVLVEAIRLAIEQDPLVMYEAYKDELQKLWPTEDEDTKKRLIKTYRHLYQYGMVEANQLADLDITVSSLTGDFSHNMNLMWPELEKIQALTATLETDPELDELVYPVVVVGGSRLKGYGEHNSDTDLGIFVKPGVPEATKAIIRQRAAELFGADDQPIEIWLEEHNGALTIRDLVEPDHGTADAYWTHLLFNTVWVGQDSVVNKIRQQLLFPYFEQNQNRDLYLERLEQDLLQYRLLHKGYERHYPRVSAPQPEAVDGQSIFWDSGYRRLATQLFLSRVFLPKR
jgi:hypothetical protein